MPANQSLGVGRSRRIDTAVRQIDVATGPLILTGPDNLSVSLAAGATQDYDPPLAGLLAYAPDGARFHVVYETDPADSEERRNRPGSGKKRTSAKAAKKQTRRASSTKAKAKSSRSSSKARSRGKKS